MTHVESLFATLGSDLDREVLVDADTGCSMSAGEFLDLVSRFAAALHPSVGPGALVAIVAPATPEGIAVRYAAAALGCATVYCPGVDAPDRLPQFLASVGADLVVTFPEALPSATTSPVAIPVAVQPTSPSVLVASGGTTGVSKASTRDWQRYARMVDIGPCPGRRQLICTPLAYIAQILVDSTLIGGGVVVLRNNFHPQEVLTDIRDHRITHLTVVEPQLVRLVDAVTASSDLTSLQAISHVGCDAAASLRTRLLTRLGAPILVNPYGASEFGVVSALAAPEYSLDHPELLDSSGRIAADVDVRVGQRGTIEVRSPAVAQSYATTVSDAFGPDGWFDTHDVGTVDDAGYLRIRGRAADGRIINGRMIFPSDLQDALCAIPGVLYAVALPSPDGPGFGVAVTLADTNLGDVVSAVTDQDPDLAPAAAVVVDVMPTTEQGKPNRRLLTERLWGVRPG